MKTCIRPFAGWIIFFCLCILSFFNSSAQTLEIPNIKSFEFFGVRQAGNGEMYYMFNRVYGSFTDYTLTLISSDLKNLGTTKITLGRLVELRAVAANNGKYIFYISSDKTGHLLLFDKDGKQLAAKQIEAAKNNMNYALFQPAPDGKFFMVRPEKGETNGFKASLLDDKLEPVWEKPYFPVDKGEFEPFLVTSNDTRFAVAFTFQKASEVVALNTADGSELYRTKLDHLENNRLYPKLMTLDKDNNLALTGKYAGKWEREDDPNHNYFFQILGAAGTETAFNFGSWDPQHIEQASSKSTFPTYTAGDPPVVFMHSMHSTPKGFQVVAESIKFVTVTSKDYQAVTGNAPPATAVATAGPGSFFAMDFLLLDYDNQGNLREVKRIAKPVKRTQTEGLINVQSPNGAAEKLKNFGRLAYRGTVTDEKGNPFYLVMNANHNEQYAGFLGANDKADNILTRDYLGLKVVPSSNTQSEMMNPVYKEDLDDNTMNGWLRHSEILPSSAGTFVVCTYEKDKLTMKKRNVISQPNPQRIKGVFNAAYSKTGSFPGGGVYNLYFSETGEKGNVKYVFTCTDRNLQWLNGEIFEVPATSSIHDVISNGNWMLIDFLDGRDNIHYAWTINSSGKIINALRSSPIRMGDVQFDNGQLSKTTENGFFSVHRGASTKPPYRSAYLVIYYDQSGKKVWEDKVFDKEYSGVGMIKNREQGLALMRSNIVKYTLNGKDTLSYSQQEAICYDLAGLKTSYVFPPEKDSVLYVPWAQDSQHGKFIAGVKYNSQRQKWVSQGIFFKPVNTGTLPAVLDWQPIAQQLGKINLLLDFQEGNLRFTMHDIVPHSGGVALVTELMRYREDGYNSGSGGYESKDGTSLDFVVFLFDELGTFKKLYSIPKLPLNMTPVSNKEELSYQCINGTGADRKIIFTGIDDIALYAFSTALDDQPAPRVFLNADARLKPVVVVQEKIEEPSLTPRLDNFANKLDAFSQKVDRLMGDYPAPPSFQSDPNTGMVPAGTNYIFVYRKYPEENRIDWVRRDLK